MISIKLEYYWQMRVCCHIHRHRKFEWNGHPASIQACSHHCTQKVSIKLVYYNLIRKLLHSQAYGHQNHALHVNLFIVFICNRKQLDLAMQANFLPLFPFSPSPHLSFSLPPSSAHMSGKVFFPLLTPINWRNFFRATRAIKLNPSVMCRCAWNPSS